MFKEVIECDSLKSIFEAVKTIKNNDNGINSFYYRGQSDAEWFLASSLKRESIEKYKVADEIEKNKIIIEEIEKEQNLLKSFKKENKDDLKLISAINFLIRKFNLDLKLLNIYSKHKMDETVMFIALMQHYGTKTRALDFTQNLLIALYFAITDAQKDAALWVLDKKMMLKILFNQNTSEYIEFPELLDVNYIPRDNYSKYLKENLKFYKERLITYENPNKLNCYQHQEFAKDFFDLDQSIYEERNIGREVYSVFVGDLNADIFNERIHRQSGVFILQSYKPMDIKEEYDEMIKGIRNGHFKAKGLEFNSDKIHSPFTKIIIKKECHKEIKDYLELVGITKESLGL